MPAQASCPELAVLARRVVAVLQDAGHEAYWAGGCVRDRLLGRQPSDYDVATGATPEQVRALFPGAVLVGRAFGVVRAPLKGVFFEVATFRRDSVYQDGRHPENVTFTDAPTDARRRDFTVNAMFYDPQTGTLHDFVGGRRDLEARLVRCVGDAAGRFREDHLRLLRAVRFAATLGFTLEAETERAIRTHAALVLRVSAERVRDELTRTLLESARAGQALRLLEDVGLLGALLPEVAAMRGQDQPPRFHPEGDVMTHTVIMLDAMRTADPRLAYAVLLHDVGKPATARQADDRLRFDGHACVGAETAHRILRRLRFSNDDADVVAACIRRHMRFKDVPNMKTATLRRFAGAPTFPLELELHRLDCIASHGNLDTHRFLTDFVEKRSREPVLPPPWVTGRDVMHLGVPQGPGVGAWLRSAYDVQLEGRVSCREELLQWLRAEYARQGGNNG